MKAIKIFLIILILVSCKNEKSPIEVFLYKFKNEVSSQELKELKTIPRDSIFNDLSFLSEEFGNSFVNLSKDSIGINNFLGVNDSFPERKNRLLLLALHSNLNNNEIELGELKSTLKAHYIRKEDEREKKNKINYEGLLKVVKANDEKFKIGDTIKFLIPLQKKQGKKYTFFNGYPTTLDYSHVKDTLVIEGVLSEKFYEKQSNPYPDRPIPDPIDLTFKILITKMSDKDVSFLLTHLNKSFKRGDYFPMNLGYYGRPIE